MSNLLILGLWILCSCPFLAIFQYVFGIDNIIVSLISLGLGFILMAVLYTKLLVTKENTAKQAHGEIRRVEEVYYSHIKGKVPTYTGTSINSKGKAWHHYHYREKVVAVEHACVIYYNDGTTECVTVREDNPMFQFYDSQCVKHSDTKI